MAISGVVGAIYKSSGVSINISVVAGLANSGDNKTYQIDQTDKRYWDKNAIFTVQKSIDGGNTFFTITTGFTIQYPGGVVVFETAQNPSHVFGVLGKYFPLTQIGGGFNWSLDMKIDTLECSTFANNGWKSYIPSTRGFSGSFEKYFLNEERKNLLPSFDKWALDANAVATGDYSLTVNGVNGSFQNSSVLVSTSPNEQYTFSCSGTGYVNITSRDANGLQLSVNADVLITGNTPVTFTTHASASSVVIALYKLDSGTSTYTFTNPQLEKGSIATTFAPRSCLAESIGEDMILVLYTDSGASKSRYEGYAKITGVSTETPNDDLVKESLDFQGDSKLYYREG